LQCPGLISGASVFGHNTRDRAAHPAIDAKWEMERREFVQISPLWSPSTKTAWALQFFSARTR